jgi:hypothetical protein
MNIPTRTKKMLGGVASLWGLLGFYRGTKHYDYSCKEEMIKYNEKMTEYNKNMEKYNIDIKKYPDIHYRVPQKIDKPQKYYISTLGYGLYGSSIYLLPYPGNLFFLKEMYMLEISLRGLNDEKKTRYYNLLEV